MSESYKKHPVITQEKVNKKLYNRWVRNLNLDYSLKGGQYKRLNSNANYKYEWTLDKAIYDFKPSAEYPTLELWVEYWKTQCLRK